MEWMNGPIEGENMEVDIGFMPQMELRSLLPSEEVPVYGENGELLYEPPPKTGKNDGPIVWTQEITMEDAMRILETKLYPFKQVRLLLFICF